MIAEIRRLESTARLLEMNESQRTKLLEKVAAHSQRFLDDISGQPAHNEADGRAIYESPLMEEVIVKIGNPAQEILLEIDNNNYDLVILNANGHNALADTVMGSVSRRVVRRSKTSVLVVRGPEED